MMDDEEGEDEVEFIMLLACAVSKWPYRLDSSYLTLKNLEPGRADNFFKKADDRNLSAVTRLNRATFVRVHEYFLRNWVKSSKLCRTYRGKTSNRRMNSLTNLGLVLHWLAKGDSLTSLCLFYGTAPSTLSRYLKFGLDCLFKALKGMPNATLSPPSHIYMKDIGASAGVMYGDIMKGCAFVTDGSLHELEKDAAAQWNYYDEEQHPDYNGWKSMQCKKGLYFFCLDGTISFHIIDCPGGWHDGRIFDRAYDFVYSLPEGVWILGDSAFPRIPGKLERCRKRSEHLPSNRLQAERQLQLETFVSSIRMRSEWGIKDIKKSWRIFDRPLPSDDEVKRKKIWTVCLRLHNLRQREMQIGQIGTVFEKDKEVY